MKFVNKNILLSLKLFVTTMQLLSLSSFIFFISFNFPKKNVMKKIVILLFLLLVTCTLIGCATSKQATQVVESSLHDTVYLNKVVYDSIYIDNWYHTYLKADTVVVEKTKYESTLISGHF